MSTYKRNKSWYVSFHFGRKRHRRKSPINTKAGAEEYESMLKQRLVRGESIDVVEKPKEKVPTLSEFYPIWMNSHVESNNKPSTVLGKKSAFEHSLLPWFGKTPIDKITTKDIEDYKAKEIKRGSKNKTINNRISYLGTCLKVAVDWGVIGCTPKINLLKVPPAQTPHLIAEECEKLLETADGIYHNMIFVVLETGLRLGELTALKWSDIDFNSGNIKVQRSITVGIEGSTKSNKIRIIPISNLLFELLHGLEKESEYVFTRPDGRPMSHSQSEKKLRKIVKEAGIKHISWHGLRHTFASRLANHEDGGVQFVQVLLGHSDIKTTMRYVHISHESLVKVINVG